MPKLQYPPSSTTQWFRWAVHQTGIPHGDPQSVNVKSECTKWSIGEWSAAFDPADGKHGMCGECGADNQDCGICGQRMKYLVEYGGLRKNASAPTSPDECSPGNMDSCGHHRG